MKNLTYGIGGIVLIALVVAAIGLFTTGCIYYMWNIVLASAFPVAHITFYQALVIAIVLNFIGGFFHSSSSSK
jgi:hypothetical protein